MKLYKPLALLTLVGGLATGCKYLDVAPTELANDTDTYASYEAGLKYLYSIYGYIPETHNPTSSLDLATGDETISSFEHELFARFPKGTYSATAPVISYWNSFFNGLRQAYSFDEIIDKIPDTSAEHKADYRAQVKFVVAYYHYMLLRCYGPIILVKEKPNINAKLSDYPKRLPLDECLQWISDKLDEAAAELPAKREEQSRYGLATSVAAKAVKAKLWLYAASPLFNGDKYKDFVDKEGVHLMPQAYDPQKWVKAREALKEAIDLAEATGHALYMKEDFEMNANDNPFPARGVIRRLRTAQIDWKGTPNPEALLVDTRPLSFYGLLGKSTPVGRAGSGYNGLSPTWAMLGRFYTKNGLPWDEDPEFANYRTDEAKTSVVDIPADHAEYGKVGGKTIYFNLNREPRFYAWIAFHGGYYELLNKDNGNPAYPIPQYMSEKGRVLLDFLRNGNQGRKERSNNYSPAGYLNKKFTTPNHRVTNRTGGQETGNHPWPVIRLGDLYLAYAEACVETGDLATAKLYLNRVRERAAIPTVETAWAGVADLTQDKLRQIVRQERMIELYLEGQNFWDMRRWLLAKEAFGTKAKGLNINANTIDEFAKVVEIPFERSFSEAQYLLPIPIDDINRNTKLVNNPGY